MKNINTIVEDIYELFNLTPIERDEKEVDDLIDNLLPVFKQSSRPYLSEESAWVINIRNVICKCAKKDGDKYQRQ